MRTALFAWGLPAFLLSLVACAPPYYTTHKGIEVSDFAGTALTAADFDLAAQVAEEMFLHDFEWDKLRVEVHADLVVCHEYRETCFKSGYGAVSCEQECVRWSDVGGLFLRNGVREVDPDATPLKVRHLVQIEPPRETGDGLWQTAFIHELMHWMLRDKGVHPSVRGAPGTADWANSMHAPPFSDSWIADVNEELYNRATGEGE